LYLTPLFDPTHSFSDYLSSFDSFLLMIVDQMLLCEAHSKQSHSLLIQLTLLKYPYKACHRFLEQWPRYSVCNRYVFQTLTDECLRVPEYDLSVPPLRFGRLQSSGQEHMSHR